ncbi:alpha/beta fold hydrolase [Caldimonas tepidiphila]|uniref:alpha/beta fold hydrolase n=1 Tax=Caldimonas tepidiphila TaxID=2315841 RepID=UPI000E5AE6FA|nr:alpha/beta hydrolase [Caldimonas tepidiphila]
MSTFLYGAHVRANGIRQHYLRYGGQGPQLLLVPGITSPAVTWGFVAERLGRRFDTYVLDVRGRGLSEASDALDYGLDACADDVGALAQALGLSGFTLLGHSMGARIGIRAARRHPRGIARLVLVDPPVSGPGRRPYPVPLERYLELIRQMRAGGGIELLRPIWPHWSEAQLRLRAEWLHTCDERATREAYAGFHADDIHADLPHLAAPALLMVAGEGGVILPQDVAEIRALAPALAVATVAGAGHMIPWDDEEGFHAALDAFLGAAA